MLNGTFANEANATIIISTAKHINAMSRQGFVALKTQLYQVIDNYQRLNVNKEPRSFKANQLREVLNSPIADNVPTVFQKMHPLILMDQAVRDRFTSYSDKSLYVMIYELLNSFHVFSLEGRLEKPADKINKLIDLCLEMNTYAERCETFVRTLQNAKNDYHYWFSQRGKNFAYRNFSHGNAGQVNAENFIQRMRSFLATVNLIDMIKLLQARLQEGRFKQHSFNTFLVKHLFLGSVNGEFMHTQKHALNDEFINNIFEWVGLILSELSSVQGHRQQYAGNQVSRL